MFKVGDTVVYSVHGLCEIDDISEKTYGKVTRTYYVMHPLEDPKLTINNPVDSDQAVMLAVMEKEEAEEVLQSFLEPGIAWIEDARLRYRNYSKLVNEGDRKEICKVINTLMRKKEEATTDKRKMYEQDRLLLSSTQNIMFKELAMSLDTSYEEITGRVNSLISQDA